MKLAKFSIRGSSRLTARVSRGFFLVVRGVFPRSFPGVLKISATFLLIVSYTVRVEQHLIAYIWFLLKTSAMCSLSHSTSFCAVHTKSSTSWSLNTANCFLSFSIHGIEPMGCALPRMVAMMITGLKQWRLGVDVSC